MITRLRLGAAQVLALQAADGEAHTGPRGLLPVKRLQAFPARLPETGVFVQSGQYVHQRHPGGTTSDLGRLWPFGRDLTPLLRVSEPLAADGRPLALLLRDAWQQGRDILTPRGRWSAPGSRLSAELQPRSVLGSGTLTRLGDLSDQDVVHLGAYRREDGWRLDQDDWPCDTAREAVTHHLLAQWERTLDRNGCPVQEPADTWFWVLRVRRVVPSVPTGALLRHLERQLGVLAEREAHEARLLADLQAYQAESSALRDTLHAQVEAHHPLAERPLHVGGYVFGRHTLSRIRRDGVHPE